MFAFHLPFVIQILQQAKDLATIVVCTQRLMFTIIKATRRLNQKLPIKRRTLIAASNHL